VLVTQAKAGKSGERAAGAVAGDGHRPRLFPERARRGGHPEQDRDGVVDRGRPGMLGRETVVDGKHRKAGSIR
jgi:hypothetical protein